MRKEIKELFVDYDIRKIDFSGIRKDYQSLDSMGNVGELKKENRYQYIEIRSEKYAGLILRIYKSKGNWYPEKISHFPERKTDENCFFCKNSIEYISPIPCELLDSYIDEFWELLQEHKVFKLKALFYLT